MLHNSLKSTELDSDKIQRVYTSPEGYKGLSGFHKYWGKKPIETWIFLIENLTQPDDIILDPFLGSGLIAKECVEKNRRFIGFDVNPISIELTQLYLQLPSYIELSNVISELETKLKNTINHKYLLSNGNIATHFLWDNDKITKVWTKKSNRRIEIDLDHNEIIQFQSIESYQPQNIRNLCLFNNSRINSRKNLTITDLFTPRALQAIDLLKAEIENYDDKIKRALLLILSAALGQMSKMVFAVSKRGKTKGKAIEKIEVGSWVIGYWRPQQHFEINPWNCYHNKARKLLKAIKSLDTQKTTSISSDLSSFLHNCEDTYIRVGDAETLIKEIPDNSIKVILTDPPHGDRIPYLELSEMWNSVLGFHSNYEAELVVSNAKERSKNIGVYQKKLSSIFYECARVLDNNGLLAVMFNARSNHYWNSLYELEKSSELKYIGCYPLEYSAGSVVQDNRKGGLKTDFVLLYGKNTTQLYKEYIINIFSAIREWSTNYPNKSN
ncbi:DNA methyltransferase [Crocosphaera sp.]|uniref:DNA methyltransferase n=1 Tax=Crocosphaera sp. TaxID=2729996 RepID=UPI0026360792|nr:DNA methyltransferase [Crocosphaera sp.]MDJ0581000.1 DNA methyltransferase [Crocosphaera sp.]